MAQIKHTGNSRIIYGKIVYYGPSRSGKTTNLQWLHKKLDPQSVEQLYSLETEGDRTLFFDLLPINLGSLHGTNLRLKVYTVPGQVKYNTTRKMVLTGADAVVFVADSEKARHTDNVESLKNLKENLVANGLQMKTIPLVMQYNKRDVTPSLPVATMDKKLNPLKRPSYPSVAIDADDYGVWESFVAVLGEMIHALDEKYNLGTPEDVSKIIRNLDHNLKGHLKKTDFISEIDLPRASSGTSPAQPVVNPRRPEKPGLLTRITQRFKK